MEKLTAQSDFRNYAGKARYLAWLISNGEAVPETWIVSPLVEDDAIADNVGSILAPGAVYAVRSSAAVADSALLSHAGRLPSELDVRMEEVPAAIGRVRASANLGSPSEEVGRAGSAEPVPMSVIVQPMIASLVAGVSFSCNPMTGLNEVVVEAVAGRRYGVADDEVLPDRWIHRWGDWQERPETAVLGDDLMHSIVEDTKRIASAFGRPAALEWVWDGSDIWWVQMSPIVGVEHVAIYSNRISREVMPGVIKPLVWSVNVPVVNQAWVDLFTEFIGPNDIEPRGLARSFAYRSYFNMQAIGDIFELAGMRRDSLELLLGFPTGSDRPSFKPSASTIRLLPRMLLAAGRVSRYGKRADAEVQELLGAYGSFRDSELASMSDEDILAEIDSLMRLGTRAAYANIVVPLLANLYNSRLRRRLEKAGFDPETVDIGHHVAGLVEFSPNVQLEELAALFDELDPAALSDIRNRGYVALPVELREGIDAFLDQFGFLSISGSDFSLETWRENPDAVVSMAIEHSGVRAAVPRISWEDAKSSLPIMTRPVAEFIRRRTRTYIARRESVSQTYTYGISHLRQHFLEIGKRLVERGILETRDDVMYLFLDEVRAALLAKPHDERPIDVVKARRSQIEELTEVDLPEVIYGDDFLASRSPDPVDRLSGIPTSRGHCRGTVRIVRDMSDFSAVQAGDILAIPHSDVAWTPLFARAGAVIAESGGMLSHSSITAREYGIPCVVSVAGALRLPNGATVLVDGYAGTVTVEHR